LVNPPFDLALQNEANDQLLNIFLVDVQLLPGLVNVDIINMGDELKTLARKDSSSLVYGLIRSMRYWVRKLLSSSPIYERINGSFIIVEPLSIDMFQQ
jgi:hypothetical protein